VKDDLRSIFTVETFADRRLLKATGLSGIAILFGAELGILQRILGTVSLTGKEWVVCILAAFSIVVASEIQKFFRRRRAPEVVESDAGPAVALEPATP
jgi:Ca2+-transporting ATPase